MISIIAPQGEYNMPDADYSCVNEVLTIKEIQQLYGVSNTAVRAACENGWLPEGSYRRSGSTWLIARVVAEQRWKDGPYPPGPRR